MSDTNPFPTTDPDPTPPPADDTPAAAPARVLADAPKDTDEDAATGYAVYDRRLARYLGGVTKDKPSKRDATKDAGHPDVSIVRV